MASFRKHAAKKKEPETDDAKAEPVDGAKVEAKDEDSGDESIDDSKCKNVPPGEEADVRDVIYSLEILGETLFFNQTRLFRMLKECWVICYIMFCPWNTKCSFQLSHPKPFVCYYCQTYLLLSPCCDW